MTAVAPRALPDPLLGECWYLARAGVHVELAETRVKDGQVEVRATPVGKKQHWTHWMPWLSFYRRINDGSYLPSGLGSSADHGRSLVAGPEGVPSSASNRGRRSIGSPDGQPATKEVTMSTATTEREAHPDPKPASRKRSGGKSAPKAAEPKAETAAKAEDSKAEDSQAPEVDVKGLESALIVAVKEAVKGVKTTKKAVYLRLGVGSGGKDNGGKTTIGYVTPQKKSLRVEVPNGKGGFDVVKVADEKDIPSAVAAMKPLAEAAKS